VTVDKLLKDLFGGDDEPAVVPGPAAPAAAEATAKPVDPERKRKRDDFVERYTTGDPAEGFTTDEAIEHLRDLREEMTPAEFRAAMQQTLEHLPPSQRDDFVAIMQQYKEGQPASDSAAPGEDAAPQGTAAAPLGGLLSGLMGGGLAGGRGIDLGDLLGDLQRSGTSAPSPAPGQQPTEADFVALLNSPLARAVLGGVAAYGLQGKQADDEEDQQGTRSPA
jgi:hypothetical protein